MSDAGLRGLYTDLIMEHARTLHGSGLSDGGAGESHQLNPTCGDEITLRVHLDDQVPARIERLSWEGHGCAISQASASVLSDLVSGDTVEETRQRIEAFRAMLRSRGDDEGDDDLLGDAVVFSGVAKYSARVKCAMLGWVALEGALDAAGL